MSAPHCEAQEVVKVAGYLATPSESPKVKLRTPLSLIYAMLVD